MNYKKVHFVNVHGQELSGRLELPLEQHPHNYAIVAHCFTCSKNFNATRNISRALTNSGYGVLRFDFTGLGDSEGDFSDTNFSGNVDDLLAAVDFLKTHYAAPSLLIGHSLGGAAAIFASAKAKSIKALVTIAAPSDTKHVQDLFGDQVEAIRKNGAATVELSGRAFKIKEDFLDDINEQMLTDTLARLNKPILIAHAPQDKVVGIHHAEKLYKAARHPKSFISIDGADHLLNDKADSQYLGGVISGWAARYLHIPPAEKIKSSHQVLASLDQEDKFTTQVKTGSHYFTADEPVDFGGNNFGPSPYQLLSSSLATCTVMTLQMYARRKQWPLENVECHVNYSKKHATDCEHCEDSTSKIDTFERQIKLTGPIDEKQTQRLLQIADKCPVHRTLDSKTQVHTKLITE